MYLDAAPLFALQHYPLTFSSHVKFNIWNYQLHILSLSLSGSNWGYDQLSLFNPSLPVFHHLSSDESHRLLVAGMMLSHRLLVAGMMLAPQSKCSVPGSFENETLLICIIYIQEKVHQSIPKADTGLPWCTWCWNFSLVYSFNIKLHLSGSSFTISLTRGQGSFYSGKISHEF